jgi:hypothetical protein
MDYTRTVSDVINASIGDSETQTTNRTKILDYVNRVSLRMLRESNWQFLESETYKFITKPGATKYWLGSFPAPSGSVDTCLGLDDLRSVIPNSVFDLTEPRQLTEDAKSIRTQIEFLYQDGQDRLGRPRSFACYPDQPKVLHIWPPPDNQNNYYPVPPQTLTGQIQLGSLSNRKLYIETTYVDSFGGESIPSLPQVQAVAAGHLLTVNAPSPEVPAASGINYPFWNVYVATSPQGPYYLQNVQPLQQGEVWIEPMGGVSSLASFPQYIPVGNQYVLFIDGTGQLRSEQIQGAPMFAVVYTLRTDGTTWSIEARPDSSLSSVQVNMTFNVPQLIDAQGNLWQLALEPDNKLVGQYIPYPFSQNPPTQVNVGNGYVLSVKPDGSLTTTVVPGAPNVANIVIKTVAGQSFFVTAGPNGGLNETPQGPGAQSFLLTDSQGTVWELVAEADGTIDTIPTTVTLQSVIYAPSNPTIEPLAGYVIAFRYMRERVQLTDVSQTLQIPDDYFDIVVAGVNYYVALYTAKADDENLKAPIWKREFMEGLSQIRRDVRENFRHADFINPDTASQRTGDWAWFY